MNSSCTRNFGAVAGRVMIGLVFAAMIGSLDVAPSFAKDKGDRDGRNDRDRYEQRGRGYDNNRHDRGRRREYRTYTYRERVYLPPPVIYAPPPPPGIGIFFPPIFFHL
ncbi:MAG: hypothetical protein PHD54_13530 [Desulfuromonadaceae bacterium]|nr:hypothetical protein [Desulfuromonadaceae bacterium]